MALDSLREFHDTLFGRYDGHIFATGFVPNVPKVHMQDFRLELSGMVISHENKEEHKYAGVLVTMDTLDGVQGEQLWLARPSAEHVVYANSVPYSYRIQPINGEPYDIDRYMRGEISFGERLHRSAEMDIAMKTLILRGILDLQAVRFGKRVSEQLRKQGQPAAKPF